MDNPHFSNVNITTYCLLRLVSMFFLLEPTIFLEIGQLHCLWCELPPSCLILVISVSVCMRSAFASQPVLKLEAPGLGKLNGRFLVGTAERIPHLELVDTTGAGDAFIGAVLYGTLNHRSHIWKACC